MKKILFPILMILFVVGGAAGANYLRNASAAKPVDAHNGGDEAHSKKDKKDAKGKKDKKDKKKKDKSSDSKGSGSDGSNVSYMKFKRQFVVPVMRRDKIDALVIMNLNVELNDDAPDNIYNFEPKLRDAIMRELLSLSNDNIFGENLTSAESYETLRGTLLTAAKAVLPDGVQDILILDIARQEQ